ncbi:MAG: response regulator, partial [Thiovulaceae bacterium]|nr:response regulator [Sulfurimonadaceae bacterium]
MEDKLSILIVDDLIDNRLAIKIALKKEGYYLYEASDGREALKKSIELMPDVILMDGMMPIMDGYEATKAIRSLEEFKRTPILMITALSEKDDKIKALNYGVNDFISKPFDKHELIARCKSYANLSKINKQYILSSKNHSTNLPNKSALMDDIKLCENPILVLFKIKDYEVLEEFYSEEVVDKIEQEFAKMVHTLTPENCKEAILYHTSDGEFALLNDKKDIKIILSEVYAT